MIKDAKQNFTKDTPNDTYMSNMSLVLYKALNPNKQYSQSHATNIKTMKILTTIFNCTINSDVIMTQ